MSPLSAEVSYKHAKRSFGISSIFESLTHSCLSGSHISRSHFDTACGETLSFSASACCVSPFSFLCFLMSLGELLIDETMVWGQALVDAYKIESTVANYPRIVIMDSVAREIMNCPKLKDYLRTDFDDCYFLNYLADCYYVGEFLEAGFERMKEEANLSDPKIKQKFIWHMKFLNAELKKKKEKYRLSL